VLTLLICNEISAFMKNVFQLIDAKK